MLSTAEPSGNGLQSVEVAVSPEEKFREYLATQGMRLTRERAIIVEEVFSSHEHFEADDLVNRLAHKKDKRRVSRSTIYRTIASLEEAGMIRRVARQDDRDVFELDYGYPQHDHLICKKCGELIEFQNDQIAQLVQQIAREHGFRTDGHRLEVYGLCDSCCGPPQTRPSKLNLL